jgi:hypothetical protein
MLTNMSKCKEHGIVRVKWSGPFTYKAYKERKTDLLNNNGLYQIYGQHVVFGPDSLLYIGMANDRTFDKRLRDHECWLDIECDVSIRLGVLDLDNEQRRTEDIKQLLTEVEALIIWWHSPPYNSSNIQTYNVKRRLHVQNWDARGRLLHEYTNCWGEKAIERPKE